jgi:hypothetical protein
MMGGALTPDQPGHSIAGFGWDGDNKKKRQA